MSQLCLTFCGDTPRGIQRNIMQLYERVEMASRVMANQHTVVAACCLDVGSNLICEVCLSRSYIL